MWSSHFGERSGLPCLVKKVALPEGFTYTSANNTEWLDVDGINAIIKPIEAELAAEVNK